MGNNQIDIINIQTGLLKPIAKEVATLAKKGQMKEAAQIISKQLTPDPQLLKAYGSSASGMLATFTDKIKLLKEKVAGPLLEFLIKKTGEWADWLDKNQDKVEEIAKSIGKGIVNAVKAVMKAVKFLADNWKTILAVVKVLAGVWIAGKLVKGLSTIIGLAARFAGAMRSAAAAAASASGAGAGGGKGGGLLGKAGKAAGVIGLAVTAAELGGEVGTGLGKAFSSAESNKRIAQAERISARIGPSMSKEEYKAFMASQQRKGKAPSKEKLESDALKAQLDPTKVPKQRRGGGAGGRKVKRMTVERFEVRDRDFSRLSSKFAVGVRRESRAMRQIAGLGLGAGAVGVGVR